MSLDRGIQGTLIRNVAEAWGAKDMAGAVDWVKDLPPGSSKYAALESLVSEWAANDPKEAADYLAQTLPRSESLVETRSMVSLAGAWARCDPEEAARWAAALPDSSLRNTFLHVLFSDWGHSSYQEAASYALSLPDQVGVREAVLAVVQGWVVSDARDASKWVASFPDGQLRNDAIDRVVDDWQHRDAAAAATWLGSLGETESVQRRLASLIGSWSLLDPAKAEEWVATSPLSDREISSVNIECVQRGNPFGPSCVLMRRQAIMDVGCFDAELGFEEDYDMWLRITERFGLDAFLPQSQVFTYYSCTPAQRKAAIERRNFSIRGERIRDYLSRRYGIQCALQQWLPQAGGSKINRQSLAKPIA